MRDEVPGAAAVAIAADSLERSHVRISGRVESENELRALDAQHAAIDREIREMRFFTYGKASNRRVLGSMNEFAFMLGYYMEKTSDPPALALRLADAPMRALEGAGKWQEFGVPRQEKSRSNC